MCCSGPTSMGRKSVHGQELPRHLWVSLLNPLAWISIWEASLSLVKRERGLNIKWMPPFARESSTSESLSETEASVAGLQALNSPLVNPIVTPRWKQVRQARQKVAGLSQPALGSCCRTSVHSHPAKVSISRSTLSQSLSSVQFVHNQ